MPVWPFLIALCAAFFGWALGRRDWPAIKGLAIMLFAYALTRLAVGAFPDDFPIVAAMVWLGAAGAALSVTKLRVFPSLLAIIPLCYFWASVFDAPRVVGSVPYVFADLFAVAAMTWTGQYAGIRYLGSNLARRGLYRDRGVARVAEK